MVRIQVPTFGPAGGDDEIVLGWTILWREVGQVDLDAVLVQLSLELGIINVTFDEQIPRLLVDCAICADLPTKIQSLGEGDSLNERG